MLSNKIDRDWAAQLLLGDVKGQLLDDLVVLVLESDFRRANFVRCDRDVHRICSQ